MCSQIVLPIHICLHVLRVMNFSVQKATVGCIVGVMSMYADGTYACALPSRNEVQSRQRCMYYFRRNPFASHTQSRLQCTKNPARRANESRSHFDASTPVNASSTCNVVRFFFSIESTDAHSPETTH